jgi:ferrochelatase
MTTEIGTPRRLGIVLMQFGGPDSLEAVEPFLFELFNDPDIFELPFGPRFQKWLAGQISRRRAPGVAKKYGEIGGKSPIVELTNRQIDALRASLLVTHPELNANIYLAGRYWKPFTEDTVKRMMADGITDAVLLPLYAQYSSVNAGSSFNEWDRVTKRLGAAIHDVRIREYYRNAKYLAALNARIEEGLARFADPSRVYLLFSAHGTPVDIVERGDPYARQIRETMEAIMDLRGRSNTYSLSFQSKVGPKQWLTPSTTDTLKELGQTGVQDLLVIPIAFVSDHIETLHELGIEERHNAQANGIAHYEVMEGLNDHPLFIECLADLVVDAVHQLQGVVA